MAHISLFYVFICVVDTLNVYKRPVHNTTKQYYLTIAPKAVLTSFTLCMYIIRMYVPRILYISYGIHIVKINAEDIT